MLADQLTRDGDLTQAASVYAQVAEAYARADRMQEGLAIAFRAHSLGPAWFTIKTVGTMLDHLGEAAVPVCTRAAESHWRSGRITEALQLYYHATQLDPSDSSALIRLAQAYEHQTLYKEATATYVVASRRLLEQGNNAGFIAVAEQILRIDGGHVGTLRELARAYLLVGEPRRAVAKLTALMQVSPEDPAGYEILAQAFACIGKEDVALSVLTRLSNDLRHHGLEDEAADLLWRASRWQPDNLPFQRKVAALANNEIQTNIHDDDADLREGVMTLGADDVNQLDENSGVYRDREGTSMLSLEDIAIMDELSQSRGGDGELGNTITRADSPPPMPPKRVPPARPNPRAIGYDDEPRTKVMDDEPPTRVMDDEPPTRVMDDEAPTLAPPGRGRPRPSTARAGRRPILTKHEGTIVLDLRDLAVVGESREESVVLDISDVADGPPDEYKLPDLIFDEDSSEIELAPGDLVTINRQMPGPPPVATAIRPQRAPKSPTVPLKVARPALQPLSSAQRRAHGIDEDAPTHPPEARMPGKPNVRPEDLEEEQPTAMMAVDAGELVKDLLKKKRTGRDRSASLVDKLAAPGSKRRQQEALRKAEAKRSEAKDAQDANEAKVPTPTKRTKPKTEVGKRAVRGGSARRGSSRHQPVTTTAPQAVVPQAHSTGPQQFASDLPPAVTGDTHVGPAPTGAAGQTAPPPGQTAPPPGQTAPPTSSKRKTGIKWRKPTAPKPAKPPGDKNDK